ncbi:tyrosine-type recombinase/integrase [Litorivivens sp.]|uniref:tyrosine-type recombinase/integrase n=1 Tax=Litorivivens sp. TaxID=2020868 RepID=UPI0035619FFF
MARPQKDKPLDLSKPTEITAGSIQRLNCPQGKSQAFLRDIKSPSLSVRVTTNGAKSFVFEGKIHRQTIRRTIGDVREWSIEEARIESNRLRVLLDNGHDPRDIERRQKAERAAKKAEEIANRITVGEVLDRYIEERRPYWGEANYKDHLKMIAPGGLPRKNRAGVMTVPGPLVDLLGMRLVDLDGVVVETWAARESKSRPARVRLALRLLKAFLRWAAQEPGLMGKANPDAASSRKAREVSGKAKPKTDYLQREQLEVWFSYVRQIQNSVISAYLQCLLLTGARREELATIKWGDVNFQWSGLVLKDKVEESRAVPLTPYVAYLLNTLPRRNEWVFSSPTSKSGRLVEPAIAHRQVCDAAGLKVTLHGLRRSFKSLSEWLEIPVGVVAQIMGHKPSATAEKHYTIRPLDLLRIHHGKIEDWILDQAQVEYKHQQSLGSFRLVSQNGYSS